MKIEIEGEEFLEVGHVNGADFESGRYKIFRRVETNEMPQLEFADVFECRANDSISRERWVITSPPDIDGEFKFGNPRCANNGWLVQSLKKEKGVNLWRNGQLIWENK